MSDEKSTQTEEPNFRYNAALAQDIENKWQKIWDEQGTFWAANVNGDLKDGKGRNAEGRTAYFAMDMFPYPSGKGLHVGHPLGRAGARRRAAHALVQGNAHAGRQALERADHQLVAIVEVEACPVQRRQAVVDQCRQVGGIGDAVAFAVQEGARLLQELRVLFRLAAGERLMGE